jgi:phosphinothricin acetyltransferase
MPTESFGVAFGRRGGVCERRKNSKNRCRGKRRASRVTYDYEPRTIEHRIAWYEDHAKGNYPVFVAVNDDGRVFGWSALNRSHDRKGYQFTTENSVYVATEQRGRGIGKLLMQPLIEGARQRGLRAILADIDADNEASIRLHASFGFVKVAHFKQVGFKFGRWLDVIYMELLLRAPNFPTPRN